MAVYFYSSRPQELLEEFESRLGHPQEWKCISNWVKCEDAGSYTHTSPDLKDRAIMKARIDDDKLVFNIINNDSFDLSSADYSRYHGQMVEAFLRQLDLKFSLITSSPQCGDGDQWS